jgi:Zn-dependent M28 family amino/carboxypeptidase
VLIVHETAPASYGWATVKNSNTNTMFDIVRQGAQAKSHPQLEAWIQRDVAVDLLQGARAWTSTRRRPRPRTREFQPQELKGATFSAAYAVDRQVIVSKNVAGRVKGRKRPGETVIYSAHWDHLGVGAAGRPGDRIYNGAIDNATGIAALIGAGPRVQASAPAPQRSSCSWPSRPRSAACWVRSTTRPTRCIPLAKTVGVI